MTEYDAYIDSICEQIMDYESDVQYMVDMVVGICQYINQRNWFNERIINGKESRLSGKF